ncbi:uL22 family ribosomal protein [Candidatus Vidania fulgoroideorum]
MKILYYNQKNIKYSFKKLRKIISAFKKQSILKIFELTYFKDNKGFIIINDIIKKSLYNLIYLGYKLFDIINHIIYVNKGNSTKKLHKKAKGQSGFIKKKNNKIFLNIYLNGK